MPEPACGPDCLVMRVVAGNGARSLPESPDARARALDGLAYHHLLGLWLAESGPAEASGLSAEHRKGLLVAALRTRLHLEAGERAREALRGAGFDVLVFKGAGLIRAGVYPDVRARPVSDADLLVRGPPPETAMRVLCAAGFRPWVPWAAGVETWLPAATLSDARVPEGMEATVDLHWRLPYGSYRSGSEGPGDELWRDARPEPGLPSPETQLLLAAEHFVGHLRVFPHLRALADAVRLLPRIADPEALATKARVRRATRPLRCVLWLLERRLGVAVPPSVRSAVGVPERLGALAERALDPTHLAGVGASGRRSGRVGGVVTQAFLQGSAGGFVRQLRQVLHPPGAWLARWRAEPNGALRTRVAYWAELARWAVGRSASPLSANQAFEGDRGRL